MYTITLNDGTKIEGIKFERNVFWSNSELRPEMFRGKLTPVTITNNEGKSGIDDGITGTHEHMELCYCKMMEGKYAFWLADIPNDRWAFEKLRADVDYAIMLGGGSF